MLKWAWIGAFGFAALSILAVTLAWAGANFLSTNLGFFAILAAPLALVALFFSLAVLLMSAVEIIASPGSMFEKLAWFACILLLGWIGLLVYYFFGRKWLEGGY